MPLSPISLTQPSVSRAAWLASLPPAQQALVMAKLAPTAEERASLDYLWSFWSRPEQQAPGGEWFAWLILAGRGWGKTRTGAEWIRDQVENHGARRIALVARTAPDCRDVMVEGESGLLAISPPWNRPKYFPSKRRVVWPNGAIATMYSADEPDLLRGPQHDRAWADEAATWRYVQETWANLLMGLRLGERPRVVITTTPRPIPIIRELRSAATTAVTRGRTGDNAANLAPTFLTQVVAKYQGTRLGRQELDGEVLDDTPGALWTRAMLEGVHVRRAPEMRRIIISIDPAVTSNASSDETGIGVAGLGVDGRGYLLEDLTGRYTPAEWARVALAAFKRWKADRVIAEVNNGGDLVEANLRSFKDEKAGLDGKVVPYTAIHASRGKAIRAEPVSGLYEQRRVSHVGALPALEDELCGWDATAGMKSPNRLDWTVWALTFLMLGGGARASFGTFTGLKNRLPQRRTL